MKKMKLHIKGMHCISCEILLEKEIKKIRGLQSCKVHHKNGNAEIECDENFSWETLKEVVHECGYELEEEHEGNGNRDRAQQTGVKPDYVRIGLIALVMGALFFVVMRIEVTRFLPDFGNQVNVFIAILLGIAASLSTCLALIGGIVMSFGSMVNVQEGRANRLAARALPHIYFHIGRVAGFMVLGGMLGLLGSRIQYSLSFTGYLTMLIAIVMFYIGLQILGIVPNITTFGFHLPKFLSGKIHEVDGNAGHFTPMVIGVLTFFLPCGFTQSMQLAAVASGNVVTGAFTMGAFALGTVPVLLSIGIGSTYAKKERAVVFNQIIGVIIIFFALYSLNSGLVLAGSSVTMNVWNTGGPTAAEMTDNAVQVVRMDVDWTFKPTEFTVKKGIPVRWEIRGINVSGCSNEVVIPQLNIRQKIGTGMNIIEFTPEKKGVLPFSCWMGMLNGRFLVTD